MCKLDRLIAIVLIAAMATALFSGCGGTAPSSVPEEPSVAAAAEAPEESAAPEAAEPAVETEPEPEAEPEPAEADSTLPEEEEPTPDSSALYPISEDGMGLQELTACYQAAYNRYLAK